jgi:hypothetical protein
MDDLVLIDDGPSAYSPGRTGTAKRVAVPLALVQRQTGTVAHVLRDPLTACRHILRTAIGMVERAKSSTQME